MAEPVTTFYRVEVDCTVEGNKPPVCKASGPPSKSNLAGVFDKSGENDDSGENVFNTRPRRRLGEGPSASNTNAAAKLAAAGAALKGIKNSMEKAGEAPAVAAAVAAGPAVPAAPKVVPKPTLTFANELKAATEKRRRVIEPPAVGGRRKTQRKQKSNQSRRVKKN